ncbi:MAG: tetratricopeptide repeat protein [Betaproteobacteria bacterium]|nr:tetratricopeptide repeat protein [Betaproteobacteria bacterium]MBI2959848.1 tetratricopeptide repeat protein [Betaproteobacteria bacterium]
MDRFFSPPLQFAWMPIACGVALTWLAGCAQQPPKPEAPVQPREAGPAAPARPSPRALPLGHPPAAPAAASEAHLPKQDLTETVLYEFLLAEIAGQRGNIGLSAQAYADLAKRTRDPRIARRATEIAVYARMGNAAIESARIWHETDPKSQRALQSLVGLLINAGRFDEAQPYLQELLASAGDPAEAFMQLNRTLGAAADKSAALALVQRLAEAHPQLPQARYAVAQAAANAADDELALAEIRRAQALKPDWEAAVLLEAQLLQRRSNAEALGRLAEHLERHPKSRDVRLNYARVLVAEKRFSEARVEFQKLISDHPANTDVIFAVALLSMQLNDHALAEANLRRLLELDYRDKASIRMYLGQIAEEQKSLTEALRWYGEVRGGEQFFAAQVRYAHVLAKLGRLGDARGHLQQVRASNEQQRAQLVLAEAQMLREASQAKEAFDLVAKALGELPDNPELLYDYAMLADKVDRVDLLETSLKKLIKLQPDNAHAYNALGYSLADRNLRLEEARELIETALKLAPEDAFIIDSMGWVHYRLGKREEALKFLRRAFAGRPDPEIAAHLSEVLWMTGERLEAERLLQESIQKHPGNEVLNSTLKRLKP